MLAQLVHAVLLLEVLSSPDAGADPDSDNADRDDDEHHYPSPMC